MSEVCIQQAAVVAGAFFACPTVTALHLDIICPILLINSQNIQTNGASLQILDTVLTMHFTNLQIRSFENDLKQKFCTSRVFKNRRHEIVINQAQASQTL